MFTRSSQSYVAALALAASTVLASGASPALSEGVLVDARPEAHFRLPRPWRGLRLPPQSASYKIEALAIQVRVQDQVARVQASQTFVNTGDRPIEATFVFPLPYDGAIDRLTLLVDGKEYAAELLSAEEARQRYEAIVRQNKDPALLEWVGAGMFQTSVFPIPAGARRTVTLRYSQICRKSQGLTDFLFP
ncbi:MAG: VIT domain-containing protein, partial [Planctomycetota bacterium]